MKVKHSAYILSRTAALLLANLNRAGIKETVEFITRTNHFFDILNGAHSQRGIRTRNENLLPYRSLIDERFA